MFLPLICLPKLILREAFYFQSLITRKSFTLKFSLRKYRFQGMPWVIGRLVIIMAISSKFRVPGSSSRTLQVALARNLRFFFFSSRIRYLSSISRTIVIIILNAIRRPERMHGSSLVIDTNTDEYFRDSFESPRCSRRSYYFTELNRRKSFSHSHSQKIDAFSFAFHSLPPLSFSHTFFSFLAL